MHGDQHPALVLLRKTREQVLERLSDAFSKDQIGLDEFERRVDEAYARKSPDELRALVSDLGELEAIGPSGALVVPGRSAVVEHKAVPVSMALAVSGAERPRGITAVFASVERRGASLETGARVVAVCGNVELDLRDRPFPDGITELYVRAVLGNVEITVPPTVAVECEGGGFLGSFAAVNRVRAEGRDGGPILRIIGSAVLGNVEVRTRPPNLRR